MKIVIGWTAYSGYMAACWRELAQLPGIDLHVLCFNGADASGETSFIAKMPENLAYTLLDDRTRRDAAHIESLVSAEHPDVVILPGWSHPAYRRLVAARRLRDARFVMAMDTPFREDLRQRFARLWLSGFLRNIDRVVVAGERARTYARKLGFSSDRIDVGIYAYDQRLFNDRLLAARSQLADGWPRRFLFVGRYVPAKALDVLVAAYRRYRRLVSDPWQLSCCGSGPLRGLLEGVAGLHDHGFVQPDRQPELFASHGVFMLPSRYEPWGVVVAEAMASGLPAICSSACNAAVSLLHPYWNGLEVPPGDELALARAMKWMHDNPAALPEMGAAAASIATAYSAPQWARRWRAICEAALANDRELETGRHA